MKFKTLALSALIATNIIAPMVAFAESDYIEYQAQQQAKISFDEAKTIALKAVGGGVVHDVDFNFEFGLSYYEVEVFYNNTEYEVKVDANSGKVIGQKIDR